MGDEPQEKSSSGLTERGRRRLTTVIILSILVLLLMLLLIAQGAFNLSPVLSPDTTGETLLLYALSTLNFLAFVTLLFILLRNVLKLVRERRAQKLGSKFKARLVSYGIGLSFMPALLLFFFAFGLLNRSIDRWFGEPARQIVDDAQSIEENYFKKEEDDLKNVAGAIIRQLSLDGIENYDAPELKERLRQEMTTFDLSAVRIATRDGRTILQRDENRLHRPSESTLLMAEQQLLGGADLFTGRCAGESSENIYIVAGISISRRDRSPAALVVAAPFPPELTERALSIEQQHKKFHSFLFNLKRIKAIYIMLLGAVALLLIFAASWLALHLARGITVPIQALAEATARVARGNFSQPVQVPAEDELAVLVDSFNQMSAQLSENRKQLEYAAENLQRTNLALDDRRRYIETVLESLSTGVISTDEDACIATINRAALFMLGLRAKPVSGTPIGEIVEPEHGNELIRLCRRAGRTGSAQAEIEFTRPDGSRLHTATGAIALRSSEGSLQGWVIVIEDLTDLIQAERAAAWSEVARRMAHEIKNPLTPIQLSAERIMRHYQRLDQPATESRFDEVVREGTSTIVREVGALQRMVEEFSRFARLPEAKPVEGQLNDVIRDALSLYAERLDGIRLECKLADDLPVFRFDPEQMKRVMINLIDNAIEALTVGAHNGGNGASGKGRWRERVIEIESYYAKPNETARLTVSDTGHGIRPADREKLFLPKFSTRDRGTGLGLAIVSHIVADHKGRIWVEDNQPRGARFVIELPAG